MGLDVWANQGVQNVNWFLRVFRERITDCWRQGWDDRIHERERYSVYRIFKLEHSLEPYFYCVTNPNYAIQLTPLTIYLVLYVSVVWMTKSIFCLHAKPQKL